MHGAIPSTTVAPGHRKSTVLELVQDLSIYYREL